MLDHLVNEKTQQASAQGVLDSAAATRQLERLLARKAELSTMICVDDDKVFVEGSISLSLPT